MSTRIGGRVLAAALVLIVAVFVPSCSGSSTTSKSGTESVATGMARAPTVEQARRAGTIAGAIAREPSRTTKILAEHGVRSDSFEQLIIDIAKDSLLTAAYVEARAAK